jgi:hypothetical protein
LPSGGSLFAGLVQHATTGQINVQKIALALDTASNQIKATFTLDSGPVETSAAL